MVSVKISNNIIKNGNVHKKVVFHTFDESKIKKDFNAISLFKCFTKGNKNLYGCYYKCGITGGVHLVLSDTQEKLEEYIIQIGMDE